jgi:hypothetical protein
VCVYAPEQFRARKTGVTCVSDQKLKCIRFVELFGPCFTSTFFLLTRSFLSSCHSATYCSKGEICCPEERTVCSGNLHTDETLSFVSAEH